MRIGTEGKFAIELRISIVPRIFLRLLVRAISFPAFRRLRLTFIVCPGGMFVAPEANRSWRRALPRDGNVLEDTRILIAKSHDTPRISGHGMGMLQIDPMQPN